MTEELPQNMRSYTKVIEEHYFVSSWVFGERYSVCDPYFTLVTLWLHSDGVLLDNFPKLKAHDILMVSRSLMQATLPIYP